MFRTWNQNRSPESIAIQKSGLPFVIIFGGPSSGKAEVCRMIAQRLGYTHLSMADLLRKDAEVVDSARAKRCKMNTEAGMLCDSIDAHEILRENIFSNLDRKKPFIIHGYPRDPEQRTAWESDFGKATLVIVLECSDSVMADRTAIRSKLGTRAEDKPEVVHKRIQYYVKYTQPMLRDLQMQQFIMRVDGNRDIEQVYESILKLLQTYIK
ncbi:putative Adenylate kinase isoenzyme 1 [Hypsibius exemplaris]|uniref:Adenylate kinase isoenzyme 1 n=1 Tax=Hypsibius exemplaris TaxID=2072580 RepID=A0A1W0WM47_HYPEX|nr:putative Adenylate kinase isoenzyme 1 [Hypsibius exemplaris]